MPEQADLFSLLATSLKSAIRSAEFVIDGELPRIDGAITIDGYGELKFPLKVADAKKIIALGRQAPYGKGTETVVDTTVRNAIELNRAQFHLSNEWNAAVSEALIGVAKKLGLPAEQLEATPYKLLVYSVGGFFLPHRDSEKQERMVATLVVVLPNPFFGGDLRVQQGTGDKRIFFFGSRSKKLPPRFVAFYADCEHEVTPVAEGFRLTLEYSLTLKKKKSRESAPKSDAGRVKSLAELIEGWFDKQPEEPLVFAFEHQYTEQGLRLDLLKGADRSLADLVASAASKSECDVHLTRLSRKVIISAEGEDDESGDEDADEQMSDDSSGHDEKAEEIISDDWQASNWTNISGEPRAFGTLKFRSSAVVSTFGFEAWQPDSSEFQSFLGNEGAGVEKWYHRSGIVIWPGDQRSQVLLKSGFFNCIDAFCEMAAHPSQNREQCIQFARSMLETRYDTEGLEEYLPLEYHTTQRETLERFRDHLLMLHDQDTVEKFLRTEAVADLRTPLKTFVKDVCHEFGYDTFAESLKSILASREFSEHPSPAFAESEAEWLLELCLDQTKNAENTSPVTTLCELATKDFCNPQRWEPPPPYAIHTWIAVAPAKLLGDLLKSLALVGSDAEMNRVIDFATEHSDKITYGDVQVLSLKQLMPWCREHLESVPKPIESWLKTVLRKLKRLSELKDF